MHTEWSAECGTNDPVLVVPWSDASDGVAFVDLRDDPGAIDTIPEAEANPPLMQALRALNAARSPVFTAKCDAWEMPEEERAQLRLELGFGIDRNDEDTGVFAGEEAGAVAFGFASYIDCVCRDLALFASFPRHEHLVRGITRLATPFNQPNTALECVLRPAFVHLKAPQQGYAVSVYMKALDRSPQRAWKRWAAALEEVTALLRRNENFR
ncbi:MAG TPA: hypothetical protein VII58_10210 [Acidobacteriaceae bacterium]